MKTHSGLRSQTTRKCILILGGSRSGKSTYAESLAERHEGPHIYIATAEATDPEMAARINEHRKRRGPFWNTLESPLNLISSIKQNSTSKNIILVDCLTIWISNLMMASYSVIDESENLAKLMSQIEGTIIFVSNEVGQGIVPDNPLARTFRDYSGNLNQLIAEVADEVYLVTAGIPINIKKNT